jgi:hypothetical protein
MNSESREKVIVLSVFLKKGAVNEIIESIKPKKLNKKRGVEEP